MQGFVTTFLVSPTVQAPTPWKGLLGYLLQTGTLQRLDNTYVDTLWYEAFESSLSPDATMCLTHSKETYFLVRKEVGKEGWMAITCFDGERPSWTHEDCKIKLQKIISCISSTPYRPSFPPFLSHYKDKVFLPFLFASQRLGVDWEKQGLHPQCTAASSRSCCCGGQPLGSDTWKQEAWPVVESGSLPAALDDVPYSSYSLFFSRLISWMRRLCQTFYSLCFPPL